jgi:hypothetical protein
MIRTPVTLTASLLAVAALAPATAGAAGVTLGGAPTMRLVDAHHAQLHFAADALPRRATVRFAGGGRRVSSLARTGRHGGDAVYSARVTSKTALRAGTKYTLRIEVPGQAPIVRLVKLRDAASRPAGAGGASLGA